MQTLSALLGEDPKPPSAHVEGIPPKVDELVLNMLAKFPAGRPQSAEHVAERIRAILAG